MSYSVDLRQRVVAFVKADGTKAEFSVSEGSVHNWLNGGNLFDNELYVEHQDSLYGPYEPIGKPIFSELEFFCKKACS